MEKPVGVGALSDGRRKACEEIVLDGGCRWSAGEGKGVCFSVAWAPATGKLRVELGCACSDNRCFSG